MAVSSAILAVVDDSPRRLALVREATVDDFPRALPRGGSVSSASASSSESTIRTSVLVDIAALS